MCLVAVIALLSPVISFFARQSRQQAVKVATSTWARAQINVPSNIFRTKTWFGMSEGSAEVDTKTSSSSATAAAVDFSKFSVGQEYEGNLVGAKKFGIFVDIGEGVNVLIPRSQLTTSAFEKLQKQTEAKSQDKIRVELTRVVETNRTLSGKYIPANFKARPDLSTLVDKVSNSKLYSATVVSSHDFGVFAEIDELGVEGLIPASKLPEKLPKGTIKSSFP